MNNIKENIIKLKMQLDDIKIQLQPWLNSVAKLEIQSQLNAILKSSDKLTKTEVNVPTELRDLKFRLIKELDKFNEAEELQEELLQVLSRYIAVRPPRKKPILIREKSNKKSKTTTPQFELINLIKSGLLSPNTKLIKNYKGKLITSILTKEGKIKTTQNNEIILHDSPSSAAVYLTQKSQNGWTWWAVEGDEKDRTLNYYRQQYLKNTNETRR